MERAVHQVTFRSPAFPDDPHEAELGSGVHGMALAFWVADVLVAAGMRAGDPFPEDYGWMLAVPGPGRVTITCGAVDLAVDEHVVVVEDAPRRLRKPDPDAPAVVARTVAAIAAALADHPDVHDVTWVQGGPPPATA